jgi:hypothetical protein
LIHIIIHGRDEPAGIPGHRRSASFCRNVRRDELRVKGYWQTSKEFLRLPAPRKSEAAPRRDAAPIRAPAWGDEAAGGLRTVVAWTLTATKAGTLLRMELSGFRRGAGLI